jgi:UDP-N-acetylglucosamine 4,6-dehydratase
MNILKLIGRDESLFAKDILDNEAFLENEIGKCKFLVIGGAGSIGQAVVKELFKRKPDVLHVVDISENNLVELVRDIRSSYGYIEGDFKTFAIDCGSKEFELYFKQQKEFDYIFNLSALKHVRSEKDPYTLMRMIEVNILNTIKTIELAIDKKAKNYFCVSTDKAANPVNMMGASKRIMELFLAKYSETIKITTARFANVAFSDGSLLYGFNNRLNKKQPLVAPTDIRRYFITPEESGELCISAGLLGKTRDTYFPKLQSGIHETTFPEIATRYLADKGLQPRLCQSEDEARAMCRQALGSEWPCYFVKSDTTGEKAFEEFYTENETLDMDAHINLGVIKNTFKVDDALLEEFIISIQTMKEKCEWSHEQIVGLFRKIVPNFEYQDVGKNLDQKM